MNLSKSGASLSFGGRGYHYTVGPRGRRVTVGLPGTGMYYTQVKSNRSSRSRGGARPMSALASLPAPVQPRERLRLGFFASLTTPAEEKELVAGLRALVAGDSDLALVHLSQATHLPEGAFAAGMLLLQKGKLDEAIGDLRGALAGEKNLGKLTAKYQVNVHFDLSITPEFVAHLVFDGNGVRVALAEAYQHKGMNDEALAVLRELHARLPDDVVVTASLAELLYDTGPTDKAKLEEVLQLTDGIQNASEVHAVLLLYRARALHGLGLFDAASQILTKALAIKKDRGADLLRALRYERALALEGAGQHARSHKDLEELYADEPGYEDVAARLGLGSAATSGTGPE